MPRLSDAALAPWNSTSDIASASYRRWEDSGFNKRQAARQNGWKGGLRAAEAEHRRRERADIKRLRDLERRQKAQAKLSAFAQARLQIDTHESRINLLLSIQ